MKTLEYMDRVNLSEAIKEITNCFCYRGDDQDSLLAAASLNRARKYLTETLSSIESPISSHSKEAGEFSYSFHVMLRKGMVDDDEADFLWDVINSYSAAWGHILSIAERIKNNKQISFVEALSRVQRRHTSRDFTGMTQMLIALKYFFKANNIQEVQEILKDYE